MIIIAGTQRSGTTFLSKCFIDAGYDLGSNLFHEDINGGYESDAALWWANNKIDNFPFTGYTPVPSKFTEINKISFLMPVPGILASFINELNIVAKWIILKRDFEDVVNSKQSKPRFKKDHPLLRQSAEELEGYFNDSLHILEVLNQEVLIIDFDYLNECGEDVFNFTGIDIRKQINKNYDKSKINSWKKD